MPGLGTTPDESGLKSPSGAQFNSPGIYARAKVGVATGCALSKHLQAVPCHTTATISEVAPLATPPSASSSFQNLPILVTGGSGFVGSHLASRLAAAGAQVRALVRKRGDYPGL